MIIATLDWFSIQAYIGFHVVDIINLISLFIPLLLSTGNTLKKRSYPSWSASLNVPTLK